MNWKYYAPDWYTSSICAKIDQAVVQSSVQHRWKSFQHHRTKIHQPLQRRPQIISPNRDRTHSKNWPNKRHPEIKMRIKRILWNCSVEEDESWIMITERISEWNFFKSFIENFAQSELRERKVSENCVVQIYVRFVSNGEVETNAELAHPWVCVCMWLKESSSKYLHLVEIERINIRTWQCRIVQTHTHVTVKYLIWPRI